MVHVATAPRCALGALRNAGDALGTAPTVAMLAGASTKSRWAAVLVRADLWSLSKRWELEDYDDSTPNRAPAALGALVLELSLMPNVDLTRTARPREEFDDDEP